MYKRLFYVGSYDSLIQRLGRLNSYVLSASSCYNQPMIPDSISDMDSIPDKISLASLTREEQIVMADAIFAAALKGMGDSLETFAEVTHQAVSRFRQLGLAATNAEVLELERIAKL